MSRSTREIIPIGFSWSSTITNKRNCVEAKVSKTNWRLSSCLQHNAWGTFWFYSLDLFNSILTKAGIEYKGCSNISISNISNLKISLRWKMVVIRPSSSVTRIEEILRWSKIYRAFATEVEEGQDITSLYKPKFNSRNVCL